MTEALDNFPVVEYRESLHPAVLVVCDVDLVPVHLTERDDKKAVAGRFYTDTIIDEVFKFHGGRLSNTSKAYPFRSNTEISPIRFQPVQHDLEPQRVAEIGSLAAKIINGLLDDETGLGARGPFKYYSSIFGKILPLTPEYVEAYSAQER